VYNEKFRSATYIRWHLSTYHNFVKNTCKHCNVKGISPYLELRPCRLMICGHPNISCDCWDPVTCTVIKICCNCEKFCTIRHKMVSYIHHICCQNPSCSSKHGICWSDPLLLDIKGILAFHTYLFQFFLLKFCNAPI